jgi:outer membrane immunogenic protein
MKQTLSNSVILAAGLALLFTQSYASDTDHQESNVKNPRSSTASMATSTNTQKQVKPEFWSGFYGGIGLGGNFTSTELSSNQLGFVNPDGKCNVNSSISSFFPGVQFGYLHQFDSNVVMGVEADFTYNTQDRANIICPCPTNLVAKDRFTAKNRLQGSLRGRLGYALDHNLLPFLSVGVSFADMGINYNNEGGNVYNKDATQAGWLAGAGLEWGFSEKLSVRAEYYYSAYNKLNMAIPSVYGLTDPNGGAHLNVNDNTVRIALNYWF